MIMVEPGPAWERDIKFRVAKLLDVSGRIVLIVDAAAVRRVEDGTMGQMTKYRDAIVWASFPGRLLLTLLPEHVARVIMKQSLRAILQRHATKRGEHVRNAELVMTGFRVSHQDSKAKGCPFGRCALVQCGQAPAAFTSHTCAPHLDHVLQGEHRPALCTAALAGVDTAGVDTAG